MHDHIKDLRVVHDAWAGVKNGTSRRLLQAATNLGINASQVGRGIFDIEGVVIGRYEKCTMQWLAEEIWVYIPKTAKVIAQLDYHERSAAELRKELAEIEELAL